MDKAEQIASFMKEHMGIELSEAQKRILAADEVRLLTPSEAAQNTKRWMQERAKKAALEAEDG